MQKLTTAEEGIMQLIWEMERCTVSDMLDRMSEDPKPPHSSISSIVRILERKGYVSHKAYGKTHEYFPLIQKEDYAKQSLGLLLQRYFDGSVTRLVSNLVAQKEMSEEDRAALMNQIKDLD